MHKLVENFPFSNNAYNIFGRLLLEIMHADTNSNVKIILYSPKKLKTSQNLTKYCDSKCSFILFVSL